MRRPMSRPPGWLRGTNSLMAIVTPIDQQPSTKLDFALAYASLGWHVFPCHSIDATTHACTCGHDCKSPAKHPFSKLVPRGQDHATTDAATIRAWWTREPDANIGIFLAPSGLMAIDIDPRNGGYDTIDTLEAQHGPLASEVLQFTGGGGEHRVFSLPHNAGSLPGKLGPGVDVKINGYIMAEPSNHLSGGTYGWEASSSPLDGVVPSPLPDWLRGQFGEGPANRYELPAGPAKPLSERDRADLEAALQHIPAIERDTWVQVGMALHSTQAGTEAFELWDAWSRTAPEKYDPTDQTRVWHSFRNRGLSGVTKATIFDLAMQRGWVNVAPAAKPEIVTLPSSVPAATGSISPIPSVFLRTVADWLSGVPEEYHADISTVGALALGSVITGRLYRSELANWTSLLFVVSGPTGVGKNYIKTGIERLLLAADLQNLIGGDFYTHQSAIYTALRRAPAHLCVSDEFGDNFAEARKNNNSNKMTVFKALKKVYSDADHIFKSESYASFKDDEERRPIVNPALTLVGLTTPRQFFSEIKTSHIEGGLMNRLLVCSVDYEGVRTRPALSEEPPPELVEQIQRIHKPIETALPVPYDLQPVPQRVLFSDEAAALFEDFKAEQKARIADLEPTGMESMPNRWRENAMRLATMIAACERPHAPVITGTQAQWCIDYVRRLGTQTIGRLTSETGENDYQQQMNTVLAHIRQSGRAGRSLTDLSRKFRSIKRRDMAELKNHLIESGLIEEKTIETAGRSAVRLISIEGADE